MKSAAVTLIDPHKLDRNPDNPRLIFHEDEMQALQQSIASQGILVPLTVYADGGVYRLLDGERRWRSALKLGMPRVPAIVQPKPPRLTNIMMMFAIHHARQDWDPLPTAIKLEELEAEFQKTNKRLPTEKELAGLASMSRGEVRRLKKLLGLPDHYRVELMKELRKPRAEQKLTVDHVLEATNAAAALRKRDIIEEEDEESVRRAIVAKFRSGVIDNTVAPRKLARLARAVERNETSLETAKTVVRRLVQDDTYSIEQAFRESAEVADVEHSITTLAERLQRLLVSHTTRIVPPSPRTRETLEELVKIIRRLLSAH